MSSEALKQCIDRYRKSPKGKRKLREVARRYRLKLRKAVLLHYGRGRIACVKCGEDDIACLSIDHIVAVGKYRKANTYSWLKKNNYPKGYQTLCMNCQWKKKAKEQEHPHNI